MSDDNNKPIIFAAFANEHVDHIHYLRNLEAEAAAIFDSLQRIGSLCQTIIERDATVEKVLDILQEYRRRITIFHFAGHASGFQLFMQSAEGNPIAAHAGGLAEFLGKRSGLQLVFLNGCSTEPQVEALLRANVPAVIATNQAIDDAVAKDFAVRFYKGLATGTSLRIAYTEAVGDLKTQRGTNPRALYYGEEMPTVRADHDRWPWIMRFQEGSEDVGNWNIPEAAGNPLYGLPQPTASCLPESPYQYLKRFSRKDAGVFFGRGYQIRDLFHMVTSEVTRPVILFHGQAGVGKSSLLEAGLLPRLDESHDVVYVRRDRDAGLLGTLRRELSSADKGASIQQAWIQREQRVGKPLMVVLDQMEEVFTRPNARLPNELTEFLQQLHRLFLSTGVRPQGKLVLGFRKEWFSDIQKAFRKHRVPHETFLLERLDEEGIVEAVTLSPNLRSHYKLHVTPDLPDLMANDLLEDTESSVAPTLQVILSTLWNSAAPESDGKRVLDEGLYRNLKKRGTHLGAFLERQITQLNREVPGVVDSGLAIDVLAYHTTPLGTAEQRTERELNDCYQHQWPNVQQIIEKCRDDLYLLSQVSEDRRDGEPTTRLAHDTLAPLVRSRYDESDRPGQRARRILDNRSAEWEAEKDGTPLDETDLQLVEAGQSGTRSLDPDESRLIAASRRARQKRQRNRGILIGSGILAITAIVVVAVMLFFTNEKLRTALFNEREARQAEQASRGIVAADAPGQQIESLSVAVRTAEERLRAQKPMRPVELRHLFKALTVVQSGYPLRHNTAGLTSAVFSPDGRLVLTASSDGTARLWEAETYRPIRVLRHHKGAVTSARFSPNGKLVITTSRDRTACLWDAKSGKTLHELQGHTGVVWNGYFTPDNKLVVTTSFDRTARVWNSHTGELVFLLDPNVGRRYSLGDAVAAAISPDSKYVNVIHDSHTNVIWDLTNGNPVAKLEIGSGNLKSAIFHPEGKIIATVQVGGASGTGVQLWEITTGRKIRFLRLTGPGNSIAYSPNGSRLAAGTTGGEVRLWNATNGKLINLLHGHSDKINAIAFSPDNRFLVTTGSDRTVRLWNADNGRPLTVHTGHTDDIRDVNFSPDSRRVLSSSGDGTARIWRLFRDGSVHTLAGHSKWVRLLEFLDEHRMFFTVGDAGRVLFRDTSSGRKIGELSTGISRLSLAVLSEDRRLLLTVGNSSSASNRSTRDVELVCKVWEPKPRGKLIYQLPRTRSQVIGAKFSPASLVLVTSHRDGTVRMWNAANGSLRKEVEAHRERPFKIRFSPDGSKFVTVGRGNAAILRETSSGRTLHTFYPHGKKGNPIIWDLGAEFSPDGTKLFVKMGSYVVYDLSTHERLHEFKGSDRGRSLVAFTQDNRHFLTQDLDKTVCLWESNSLRKVSCHKPPMGKIKKAVSQASGSRILVLNQQDKTYRIWELQSGQVVAEYFSPYGFSQAFFSPDFDYFLSLSNREPILRVYEMSPRLAIARGKNLLKYQPNLGTVSPISRTSVLAEQRRRTVPNRPKQPDPGKAQARDPQKPSIKEDSLGPSGLPDFIKTWDGKSMVGNSKWRIILPDENANPWPSERRPPEPK